MCLIDTECGNRFTCRDGNCGSTALAQADRCNSIINCLDGSDEADCGGMYYV